jgi:hypothetical protein
LIGSLPIWKMIGMIEVAAFAATAGPVHTGLRLAAMTVTCRRTRSAASAGN